MLLVPPLFTVPFSTVASLFLNFPAHLRGSGRRARKFHACASQFKAPPFHPYPGLYLTYQVSDCSRNGAANTNTASPPCFVTDRKSIVAADRGVINLGPVLVFPVLRPTGSAFCCGLAFIRSAQYAQESEAVLLRPPRMPGSSRLPRPGIVGPLAIMS